MALGAVAVRVVYVVVAEPSAPGISDARTYHLLANNLANGEGYVRPYDLEFRGEHNPTAEFPPLFPMLLAAVPLLGGDSEDTQRLAMSVVGAGTVVLVGLLGRRVAGPAAGLVAAALAAVHPPFVQGDGALLAETLYAPLVAGVLLLLYLVVERPRSWRVATALGAVAGLAALTRGEGLLLLPLVVAPLLRRHARSGALAVAVAVAVFLPWPVRNAVRLDAFVLSNNLASAVGGANCARTYGGDQIGWWRFECNERVAAVGRDGRDEAEVAGAWRRAGIDYARDHADRVPAVMAVRWLRTWGFWRPAQQVDLEETEGRSPAWHTVGTYLQWLLVPLAAAGAWTVWRRREIALWPLLATAGVVTVTAMATYGNQRFRTTAEPALLVLVATALVAAGRRLAIR